MTRDPQRARGGRARWPGALALIAALVGLAAPAAALRAAGSAFGRVNAVAIEVAGTGRDVFGLDADELLDREVRLDWSFDTDRAPADANPAPGALLYETLDPGQAWLEISLTLGGITYAIGAERRYADIRADVLPGPFPDLFQLAVERSRQSPYRNEREFIDLVLDLPAGSVTGEALPTDLPSRAVDHPVNGVAFRINDFEIDPASGELISQRLVSFNLDIDTIEIHPVPEPASGSLLALGLGGLAAARGRRRELGRGHRAPRA